MVISPDNVRQILRAITSSTTKSITSTMNPDLLISKNVVLRTVELKTYHDGKVRGILRGEDISCSHLVSSVQPSRHARLPNKQSSEPRMLFLK